MLQQSLNSGDNIPTLGLGTWLAEDGLADSIITALDVGYRHIDCAAIYKNEAIIGAALQQKFSKGFQRADLWLTSKLWNSFHKPEDVRPACLQTLQDLNVDYLDFISHNLKKNLHTELFFSKGGVYSILASLSVLV